MDLSKIRDKIDALDDDIIKAFEERMKLVDEVAKYKIQNHKQVFDKSREDIIIEKVTDKVQTPFIKEYVPHLYHCIMDISKQRQRALINELSTEKAVKKLPSNGKNVGYLGIKGSFSHQAMMEYFDDANGIGYDNFGEIINDVSKGVLDYGIVPIENTSTGDVNLVIDLLPDSKVWMSHEFVLKIEHCLLGQKGVQLSDIKLVNSHPQAISQSKDFLDRNAIKAGLAKSTAQGALLAKESDDKSVGAIGSIHCANEYDLDIIECSINTNAYNYTRFAILQKEQVIVDNADKTSLIIEINHKSGSLYSILSLFKNRNLNLLKLVSRPIANNPWAYKFYLDFSGNIYDDSTKSILDDMSQMGAKVKIIGVYKAYEVL